MKIHHHHRVGKYKDTLDFHPTPPCATKVLLDNEEFINVVWDPCCGIGGISNILNSHGICVISSDIVDGINFLSEVTPVDNIIMNPPYKLAMEFVYHALDLARDKIAVLLRLTFMESTSRYKLFINRPPIRVHIISNRIPVYKDGKWIKGGQFAHAWFVWNNKANNTTTELRWVMTDE